MKRIFLLCLFGLSIVSACKKEDKKQEDLPNVNNVNEIKVPDGFAWENSRTIAITAAIVDNRFASSMHSIAIYDGDPYNGGVLLANGAASTSTPYQASLYLAATIKELYIVKTSPDESRIIRRFELNSGAINTSFGAIDENAVLKSPAQKTTTIDCNSGCTTTITSSTNNVNVNNGNVVCITGNNITVNFSGINGGTVKICGSNVTLQNANFSGSSSLLVASSASVNLSNFNINSSSATVQNEGTINFSGNASMGGTFVNSGTINCPSDFDINSNTVSFTNNGTMNVSGSFNFVANQSANVVNNGTLSVSNNFQHNSSGTFVNQCRLVVSANFNQSGTVQNNKYISVSGTTTLNGGELKLSNGAMFSAANFITNVKVSGSGSTSLVKITGSVTVNGSGQFSGNLQVCSNNAINTANLNGGAATGCTLYIPTDACNTVGNGSPAVSDSDADGVPNSSDAYPNDATKAYNSYYPSSTGMSTLAFEDQWPVKGDYDLNDLVISFRYKIITNAANIVVGVEGTFRLYATGGSFQNGFGVQFPVERSKVTGLSFGTLEQDQTKAVVLLFTNMRNEMVNWNTEKNMSSSAPVDYSFSFNVVNGPNISNFGLSSYNPFIWNGSDSRGRETHLAGKLPTDLANTGFFGTQDDNSSISNNRYYVTGSGLPYGIEIPASTFQYPVERVDVTQAYLRFANWAQSAGVSYTDWYSNTGSGYRNNTNIYTQ